MFCVHSYSPEMQTDHFKGKNVTWCILFAYNCVPSFMSTGVKKEWAGERKQSSAANMLH